MKAVGALPTEERVQKMNTHQWLWFYFNLMEDKKQDNQDRDNIMDYLTAFINPEMAKAVRENREATKNENAQDLNTTVNTEFERELQAMMNGENFNEIEEDFENKEDIKKSKNKSIQWKELPSSGGYQSHLSEEDFIKRAQMFEEIARTDPTNPAVKMLPRNKRLNELQMSEKQLLKNNENHNKDIIIPQVNNLNPKNKK